MRGPAIYQQLNSGYEITRVQNKITLFFIKVLASYFIVLCTNVVMLHGEAKARGSRGNEATCKKQNNFELGCAQNVCEVG